jgi:hypothetical protein
MDSLYLTFLKRLLVFSMILGILGTILWFTLPRSLVTPALPLLLFFFLSVTLISYYFQLKSAGERFIRFVNAYMLLMAAKLFLYIVVIVAYVFTHRSDVIPFMMTFFVLYLCFTIFEAVYVLGTQGNQKNK